MTRTPVQTVDLETAEQLLDELSPHRQKHLDVETSWLYRGQGDATLGLTPSAMRAGKHHRGGTEHTLPEIMRWEPAQVHFPLDGLTAEDQAGREYDLVMEFAAAADTAALAVPGDKPEWRDHHHQEEVSPVDFPPLEKRGLFALAQHYGIPTRLLDWTTKPLVAAYFAALPQARARTEGKTCPDRLAVWALSRRFVGAMLEDRPLGITLITAPRASNPNLHAQGGLFTLVRYLDPESAMHPLLSVDDFLRTAPDDLAFAFPALVKFTVPGTEARSLLRMLSIYGITAASVFPGYRGAADAVYERVFHQDAPIGSRS